MEGSVVVDLSHAVWHKSSRSNGPSDCVEVADNLPSVVAVRDSKHHGPMLTFSVEQWQAFVADVKAGEFDRG